MAGQTGTRRRRAFPWIQVAIGVVALLMAVLVVCELPMENKNGSATMPSSKDPGPGTKKEAEPGQTKSVPDEPTHPPPLPEPPKPQTQTSKGIPPSRPLLPGTDRRTSLTWNVWAENAGETLAFQPASTLRTSNEYQLVADLATLALKNGAVTKAIDSRLAETLKTATGTVRLRILIVADNSFFRLAAGAPPSQTITFSGEAVRKALQAAPPGDPSAVLRSNPNPDFVLGRVRFPFRAIKEGTGAIALSIWKDDVPVDELSIRFCVAPGEAERCSMRDAVTSTLRGGAELVRPSGQLLRDSTRAAALHFVELDERHSVGVLRMSHWSEGRFETWPLDNIGEDLRRFLDDSFMNNFAGADRAGRLATGSELYNLLAPGDAERKMLERELTALAREQKQAALWVRLLAANPRLPYAVPLGMMAVPIGGAPEFLARHFRIETPLPVMDYRPVDGCISRWMLAVPKGEAEQGDFKSALDAIRPWTRDCPGPACLDTMARFRAWIGKRDQEVEPAALFLLAHHSARGLYFTSENAMSEQGIGRRFEAPSVAVFSACNVATPSAYRFAERMARQGMAAIVAPATEVPAELGGEYFAGLASRLAAHAASEEYTLSHAHWETLRALNAKWEGRELSYLLLGNGGLRVCAPTTSAPAPDPSAAAPPAR